MSGQGFEGNDQATPATPADDCGNDMSRESAAVWSAPPGIQFAIAAAAIVAGVADQLAGEIVADGRRAVEAGEHLTAAGDAFGAKGGI